jgi:hypothetical protein
MKKIIIILTVIISLTTINKVVSQATVDFNVFYSTLSPYGRWVDNAQYGRVWICNEPGFRPYYDDGHWEYTADGWTWVSDYPWGWAPFHYGRWAEINGYGWGWVPGYDWAPAWVSWCDNDDYYGWAPLGPGLGISISIGSIPADRWCFVPRQYINSPSIHNYYVDRSRNATIYRNASFINNIHSSHNVNFVAGPRRADVERVTHTRIPTRTISFAQKPGRTVVSNNAINIYRPGVRRNTTSTSPRTNNNVTNRNVNTTVIRNNSNHAPANVHSTMNNNHRVQNSQPVHQQPIQHQQQPHQQVQQHQQHFQQQPHQQLQVRQMPQQHMNAPAQHNEPMRMPSQQGGRNSGGGGGGEHERR